MSGIYWATSTALKRGADCLEDEGPGYPARVGIEAHRLLDEMAKGRPVDMTTERQESAHAEARTLVVEYVKRHPLPEADRILSSESDRLPAHLQHRRQYRRDEPERDNIRVRLNALVGLQTAWDLAYCGADWRGVVGDEYKTGRVVDEEGNLVQAGIQAVCLAEAFPGQDYYEVRFVYLRFPDACYVHRFEADEIPALREEMGRRAMLLRERSGQPTINPYCAPGVDGTGGCAKRHSCPAYRAALAPLQGEIEVHTQSDADEWLEKIKAASKILEATKKRIQTWQMDRIRLAGGLLSEAGWDYEIREKVTRYEIPFEKGISVVRDNSIRPDAVLAFKSPSAIEESKVPGADMLLQLKRPCGSTEYVKKKVSRRTIPVQPANPLALPFTEAAEAPPGVTAVGGPLSGGVVKTAATDLPERAADGSKPAPSESASLQAQSGVVAPGAATGKAQSDDPEKRNRAPAKEAAASAGSSAGPAGLSPETKKKLRRPTPIHSCGRKCRYLSSRRPVAFCPACDVNFTTDGSPLPEKLREETPGDADRKPALISQIKQRVAPLTDEDWKRFCRETGVPPESAPSYLEAQTVEQLEQLLATAERI